MTTTTTPVTFATYATVVAAQETDQTDQMQIASASTVAAGSDGYFTYDFIISDQSAALETYTGTATDADKTTAEAYTDGYAVVASVVMNRRQMEAANADSGTVVTSNYVCLTGTLSADNAGTDAAINATTCAIAQSSCADNDTTAATLYMDCTYTSTAGTYGTENSPTDNSTTANWTAVSAADGFTKSWRWTGLPTDTTDAVQATTDSATMSVGRFFPVLDGKVYSATDLRFDGTVTGKVGYSQAVTGTATFTWGTAAWKSAAQVAGVAAAAAVVALTF